MMVTNKIKNKMYLFFTILVLFLLLFNLDPMPGRPGHGHYALIWVWQEFQLIRILPQNWYVLLDKDILYSYDAIDSSDTYIPALRMDTHRVHEILHFKYLLDWIKEPPKVIPYPPEKTELIKILNYLTSNV